MSETKTQGRLNQLVAKRLRDYRKSLGYTQEGFAHKIEMDRAGWARIERSTRNLSLNFTEGLVDRINEKTGESLDVFDLLARPESLDDEPG